MDCLHKLTSERKSEALGCPLRPEEHREAGGQTPELALLPLGLGTVTAVDESTAFSWPVCDRCGSERLEQSPEDR